MKVLWKGLAGLSKMMLLPQKGKESLNLSLLSSPLQRQTLETNGQFPILHKRKKSSDRSLHQPTGKHYANPLAQKATTEVIKTVIITECIPFSTMTSSISTSQMQKEANSYSVDNFGLCKKQPEA